MGNYIKILPKKSLARMKSVEQLVLRDNKITNIRGWLTFNFLIQPIN